MPSGGWTDEGFATNESELCSKTKPTTAETTDVTTEHQSDEMTTDVTTADTDNRVDTTTTEDTMTEEAVATEVVTTEVVTGVDTETEVHHDEISVEAETLVDGHKNDELREQSLVLLHGI